MRYLTFRLWSPALFAGVSALAAVFAWEAFCDEAPPADKPHRVPVALLDIAKVYKGCHGFNAEMSRLKGEIEEFEREVRVRQTEIAKLVPKEAGSAPASAADTVKGAELNAKLEADVAARRKAFLAEEALVYFKFYAQFEKEAVELAKRRDIGLVLRYNSDPMDPTDRASVLQGVNRAVVYTAVPDLTDELLAIINGPKL